MVSRSIFQAPPPPGNMCHLPYRSFTPSGPVKLTDANGQVIGELVPRDEDVVQADGEVASQTWVIGDSVSGTLLLRALTCSSTLMDLLGVGDEVTSGTGEL